MPTYHRRPHLNADGRTRGWGMTVQTPYGRPGLVVEHGRQRHADGHGQYLGLRIQANQRPFLWAAIDDWWNHVNLLQAPSAASPGIIPPITARTRSADWTRFMLDALAESPRSPLYTGDWWCGGEADWDGKARFQPESLQRTDRYWALGWFEGRLMGLRTLSAPDDRRVGFWRKQLRVGHQPPVVLLYVSVLEMFVILDGHDRLQAALIEGMRPEYLILAPVQHRRWPTPTNATQTRASIVRTYSHAWQKAGPAGRAGLNRGLIQAFSPLEDHVSRMRVWPLSGGWPRWRSEVRQAAMGLDPDALDALLPPSD